MEVVDEDAVTTVADDDLSVQPLASDTHEEEEDTADLHIAPSLADQEDNVALIGVETSASTSVDARTNHTADSVIVGSGGSGDDERSPNAEVYEQTPLVLASSENATPLPLYDNETTENLNMASSSTAVSLPTVERKYVPLRETNNDMTPSGVSQTAVVNRVRDANTPVIPLDIKRAALDNNAALFPLCLCRDKLQVRNDEDPPLVCQAVSSVDGKRLRCANKLTDARKRGGVALYRAHVRIPFTALCDAHLNLLHMHYCCPACGVFCLKGNFLECDAGRPCHYSHTGCLGVHTKCPHCAGDNYRTTYIDVYMQRCPSQKQANTLQELLRTCDAVRPQQPARMSVDATRSTSTSGVRVSSSATNLLYLPAAKQHVNTGFLADEADVTRLSVACAKVSRPGFVPEHEGILDAVTSNCLESVLYCLSQRSASDSAAVNNPVNMSVDADKNQPLHLAAASADFLVVYVLIQAGASVNAYNASLVTPLVAACEHGRTAVVHLLLTSGADPRHRCVYNETARSTALHAAAVNGHLQTVALLLREGGGRVEVNAKDEGGWTALTWATEHAKGDVAALLLSNGARPMLTDLEGNVCMHWAAYSGCLPVAERVASAVGRAAIAAANQYRDTPLHVACRRHNWNVVSYLLMKGADTTLRNTANESPAEMINQSAPEHIRTALVLTNRRDVGAADGVPRVIDTDISRASERLAIACVNEVDGDTLTTSSGHEHPTSTTAFRYVRSLVETLPGLDVHRRIDTLRHCDCEDDCSSGNCQCGLLNLDGSILYEDGKLSDRFSPSRTDTIYECNEACLCNKNACQNRVAQKGISQELEVFKTRDRGWAVRAREAIECGTFICEYAGEILTAPEGDARVDDSYLFEMQTGQLSHCIDAKAYGNVARFFNHGCNPNLNPVKVFWDHQDKRFPHIAFYATRDIQPAEELTFDYGDKFWIVKYRDFLCCCGAEECKYNEANIARFIAEYLHQQQEEAVDTISSMESDE